MDAEVLVAEIFSSLAATVPIAVAVIRVSDRWITELGRWYGALVGARITIEPAVVPPSSPSSPSSPGRIPTPPLRRDGGFSDPWYTPTTE